MAKINNLTRFSDHFKIDPKELEKLGILNPTLAMDTKLFIDPLLLKSSSHFEFNIDACDLYNSFFEEVIEFLALSKSRSDVPWRTAYRELSFHEIKGTCLGYGVSSISGSAFGPKLTNIITSTGKEIVDIGIRNPNLFSAMALLESDIGPDRISDMTTNIILPAIIKFNQRVLSTLGLKGVQFNIIGKSAILLRNPIQRGYIPIILLPTDILRSLPIVCDRDSLHAAASYNEFLREEVNKSIGSIWKSATKEVKEKLRSEALTSQSAFNTLLKLIDLSPKKPYDTKNDPEGILKWLENAFQFSAQHPIKLPLESNITTSKDVFNAVSLIVNQYKKLIEENGLNHILFFNGKPRHERISQYLFYGIAYSYCKVNNIDLSPEVDSGNGKVDFKFSKGFKSKILVEIKLSKNSKLVSGLDKQLNTYKKAEETDYAFYIVIDVGDLNGKDKKLIALSNKENVKNSELVFIDAVIKPTASKK